MHDDIAGTWTLIRTVPAELPMDGPDSADPWLGQPMDPPSEGWTPAGGTVLTIAADGRYSEQVDETATTGPVDWWELDGTLLDAPAPSHGQVVAESGAQHLVPDEGIDRVSYEVAGVLHGEDTAEVSDRIARDQDGTLLRLVAVDQGDGGRGRSWYRYTRTTEHSAPAAAARTEHRDPAATASAALGASRRLVLGDDRVAQILADHREAVRVDAENTRRLHEEKGIPLSAVETEGLAEILRLAVGTHRGEVTVWGQTGILHRLQDGRGLSAPPNTYAIGGRPSVTGKPPRPGNLAGNLIEEEVAAVLLATGTPNEKGVVHAASMMVSDLVRGTLRWVVLLDEASESWLEPWGPREPEEILVPVARTLRAMSDGEYARLADLVVHP